MGTVTYSADFLIVLADYKPYSWESEKGKVKGIEIDILTEALQNRMGLPISIQILPWARAQKYVETGAADGFVAFPTEKRKTYTQVSKEPVTSWGVSLFAKTKGSQVTTLARLKSLSDLKPFRLASMIGNGWAEENLKTMDVVWGHNMAQLIKLIIAERVDILPDSPEVVKFYLKELGLKGELVELHNLFSTSLHLCISNKSAYIGILPKFNETIKNMRKEGIVENIIRRYE